MNHVASTLYSPRLRITIKASCLQVVQFVCPVRGSQTQMLQVNNPTYQQCRIVPVLKGGPWRVAPFLDFEPLENKMIEITYQPMTMTTDGRKDSVGGASYGALSYVKLIWLSSISLSGISFFLLPWWIRHEVQTPRNCWAPQGGGYYCVSTACKDSAHSGALRAQLASPETTVKRTQSNVVSCTHWRTPQVLTIWDKQRYNCWPYRGCVHRFRVLMEFLKPDKPDATMSITGLPFIDVPALARKDYKMSFFTYREGQYHTKV